jgi:polar amino acid transport system substrate-binding protein
MILTLWTARRTPPSRVVSIAFFCVLAWLAAPSRASAGELIEVRIGVGLGKPPYVMASGRSGMEVEIAEKALSAGGCRMLAQYYPQARALALLRVGQLDGMLSVDEGIGGDGYFSEPYMHYQNVATTLASRKIGLGSIADLDNYSVAAFQNASLVLGDDFKALAARHRNYREHPQQITQNRLLYTGRVDVVIGDRLVFHYLNRQIEASIDTSQKLAHHPLFPPSPRKAAFRDPALRDRFNAGLKAIRQDGTYAAIVRKYQE